MKYRKEILTIVAAIFMSGSLLILHTYSTSKSNLRFAKSGTVKEWEISKQNKTVVSQQEKDSHSAPTTINFAICDKGLDGFGFGLGSTTFKFVGIENGKCHFFMGTEIENPFWDGYLDRECYVPVDYPTNFTTTDHGADLTFDQEYCTN